jgi:hypothetical protein
MSKAAKTILLLDRAYTPLMFISRRKALKMAFTGKAEFLMDEEVLRLLHKIMHNLNQFRVARKRRGEYGIKYSIFLRDKDICQYCGRQLNKKERTLDHILPRSKGGETSFLNCVAACRKCNQSKGDKSAHEVGLTLIREPYVPTRTELLQAMDKGGIWSRFVIWLEEGCGMPQAEVA